MNILLEAFLFTVACTLFGASMSYILGILL